MKRVIIFGCGKCFWKLVERIDEILLEFDIKGIWDNRLTGDVVNISGTRYNVEKPKWVGESIDAIIISSEVYFDEMKKQLCDLKIDEKIIKPCKYVYEYLMEKACEQLRNDENNPYIEYMMKNGIGVYNTYLQDKYKNKEVLVEWDKENKMFFVWHFGKKMYMKKSYSTAEAAANQYKSLLWEQSDKSPHSYVDEEFYVDSSSVVVDAGAAEGIFALSNIEKIKKVYLIESDEEWMDALKLTFAPYSEKVVFVNSFLTDYDDDAHVSLDFLCEEPIDFVKMDIEGAEIDAVLGGLQKLKSNDTKLSVCTYHKHGDEKKITNVLRAIGYTTKVNRGKMFFWYQKGFFHSPEFRNGVLKAWKHNT